MLLEIDENSSGETFNVWEKSEEVRKLDYVERTSAKSRQKTHQFNHNCALRLFYDFLQGNVGAHTERLSE